MILWAVYYENYSLLKTHVHTTQGKLQTHLFLSDWIKLTSDSPHITDSYFSVWVWYECMCLCLCSSIFDLAPCSLKNSRTRKPLLVSHISRTGQRFGNCSLNGSLSLSHLLSLHMLSCGQTGRKRLWRGPSTHYSFGLKSLINLLDSSYPTLNKHRLVQFFKACGTYLPRNVLPRPCLPMAPTGIKFVSIGIPHTELHSQTITNSKMFCRCICTYTLHYIFT